MENVHKFAFYERIIAHLKKMHEQITVCYVLRKPDVVLVMTYILFDTRRLLGKRSTNLVYMFYNAEGMCCCRAHNVPTTRLRISFHHFPKETNLLKQWLVQMNRLDPTTKLWNLTQHSVLCSQHFDDFWRWVCFDLVFTQYISVSSDNRRFY